eukprot:276272_1
MAESECSSCAEHVKSEETLRDALNGIKNQMESYQVDQLKEERARVMQLAKAIHAHTVTRWHTRVNAQEKELDAMRKKLVGRERRRSLPGGAPRKRQKCSGDEIMRLSALVDNLQTENSELQVSKCSIRHKFQRANAELDEWYHLVTNLVPAAETPLEKPQLVGKPTETPQLVETPAGPSSTSTFTTPYVVSDANPDDFPRTKAMADIKSWINELKLAHQAGLDRLSNQLVNSEAELRSVREVSEDTVRETMAACKEDIESRRVLWDEKIQTEVSKLKESHSAEIHRVNESHSEELAAGISKIQSDMEEKLKAKDTAHAGELKSLRSQHEADIETMQREAGPRDDEVERYEMMTRCEEWLEKLKSQLSSAQNELKVANKKHSVELEALKREHSGSLKSQTDSHNVAIEHLKSSQFSEIKSIRADHQLALQELKTQHGEILSGNNQSAQLAKETEIADLSAKHSNQFTEMKDNLTANFEAQLVELKSEISRMSELEGSQKSEIGQLEVRLAESETAHQSEVVRLKDEISKLTDDVKAHQDSREFEDTKQQLDDTKQQLEDTKQQLEDTRQKFETTQQQLELVTGRSDNENSGLPDAQMSGMHPKSDSNIDDVCSQPEDANSQLKASECQLEQVGQQLEDTKQQLEDAKQQLDDTKQQLENANQAAAAIQSESPKELKGSGEMMKSELRENATESDLRSEIIRLRAELESAQKRCEEADVDSVRMLMEDFAEERADLQQSVSAAQAEIAVVRDELKTVQSEYDRLEGVERELKQQLESAGSSSGSLSAELESIRESEANLKQKCVEFESRCVELTQKCEFACLKVEDFRGQVQDLDRINSEVCQENAELKLNLESLTSETNSGKECATSLGKQIENLESELTSARSKVVELESICASHKERNEKLMTRLEDVDRRFSREFDSNQETLARLKATEAERDVQISEIEKISAALEASESESAEEKRELADLRRSRAKFLAKSEEYSALPSQLNSLKRELSESMTRIRSVEKQLRTAERTAEQFKGKYVDLDAKHRATQKAKLSQNTEKATVDREVKQLRRRNKQLQKENDKCRMTKDQTRDLRHSNTDLTAERDKLQGELAACQEMVTELKAKLEQSGAEVEQARQSLSTLSAEKVTLEEAVQSTNAKNSSLESSLAATEKENGQISRQLGILQEQTVDLTSQLDLQRGEHQDALAKIEFLESSLAELEAEKEKLEEEIITLRSVISSLEEQNESLKSDLKNVKTKFDASQASCREAETKAILQRHEYQRERHSNDFKSQTIGELEEELKLNKKRVAEFREENRKLTEELSVVKPELSKTRSDFKKSSTDCQEMVVQYEQLHGRVTGLQDELSRCKKGHFEATQKLRQEFDKHRTEAETSKQNLQRELNESTTKSKTFEERYGKQLSRAESYKKQSLESYSAYIAVKKDCDKLRTYSVNKRDEFRNLRSKLCPTCTAHTSAKPRTAHQNSNGLQTPDKENMSAQN